MQVEFVDLRIFVAVAEAGSITAGADRVALSLAAASARIRALELRLGAAVFERGRRGVTLTAAGQVLLRHARVLARQEQAMRSELGDYGPGGQVTLRLAANTAALSEWLPECVADFLLAHPRVDLILAECGSEEAADAVRDERADLAVVAGHADFTGLQRRPFREDRLVVAMAASHPLAGTRVLRLADIADMQLLALSADNALQRHLRTHLARAGVQLRIRARVPGIDTLCRMLARGVGVAIVPHAALACSRAGQQLVAVPLDEAWAQRALSIVWRDTPSAILQTLLDWLQANNATRAGLGRR
ncbi:LysR family transcriptional regulator [Xanthomonas cucurbitae]|uniref:LysR family transcriptional regulator n=1 Tax=Xanthomonas cucurbitae TaxID=56453 RepID=A0A2S7DVE6_9XANT|nr:LysR substrate-binding domain-containing protein [Xanthomonas cucurbitae]PPU77794.1 LysR family transcriptional regulator [Xanthomonas cucurbitae]WDM79760.1 LysR family transcriptional regulator [Xanthomonas cucurbitae]WDM83453.1 LysR family transcriptional regulator [Xanthomonas cucurbitae]